MNKMLIIAANFTDYMINKFTYKTRLHILLLILFEE